MSVQFSTANQAALGRIKKFLQVVADPTPHIPTLMLAWQVVIREDNLRGVLAGTDRYGRPMAPVTYRPVDPNKVFNVRSKAASYLRHGQRASWKRDLLFKGISPAAAGLLANNNLGAEYRFLDGPPLAPRYQFSRVISNLNTDAVNWRPEGPNRWVAFGYWDEVMSPTGYHFLPVHFEGKRLGKNGPAIQRDLRGVRPEGRERARQVLRNWWHDVVKAYGWAE